MLLFVLLGQRGRVDLSAPLSFLQRSFPCSPGEKAGRRLGLLHVLGAKGGDVYRRWSRSDARLSPRELGPMHVQDCLE